MATAVGILIARARSLRDTRTALEELVARLDRSGDAGGKEAAAALTSACAAIGDAEDEIAVAREHEKHMRARV